MDTDSLYLAMSSDSVDQIVKPEMRQAYEADKRNWLATGKSRKGHPAYLNLNLLVQGVCGLPRSVTLFKMC